MERLDKLPFNVYLDLNSFLSKLDINDTNIIRKFSIESYNILCNNYMQNFTSEISS